MNIWLIILNAILVVALVVLAFIAVRVLEQRDTARVQRDGYREGHNRYEKERDEVRAERNKLSSELLSKESEILKIRLEQNAELNHLATQLAHLRNARNVTWPRPPKRLPSSDVLRAFAIADDAPIWIGLNQEIDDFLQELFDQVSMPPAPSMTEANRLHLAGGIEQIRLLQKRLLELHAKASKADADLEDEQKPAA